MKLFRFAVAAVALICAAAGPARARDEQEALAKRVAALEARGGEGQGDARPATGS